jgi:putative PIN family toxin of toxin-antitoxin system
MHSGANQKVKVVIDTNVFISGLTFGGKPREVLELAWNGRIEAYISPFIFSELEKVLRKVFGWRNSQIGQAIKEIRGKTILIQPRNKLYVITEKDDDNRILECALGAVAHYLITGDKKHLLPLKEYQGIKIVSPAEFLRLLPLNAL